MKIKKYLIHLFNHQKNKNISEEDLVLFNNIEEILGIKPCHIDWYKEAFSLKTSSSNISYDRLEFLGDSVLGSIISYYLFETYPHENEGYLTQMKSKIVNRKNLNLIGESLGLGKFIENNHSKLGENIFGNLLEALIGAIYMDLGYVFCKEIVLTKILTKDQILKLENKIISYKSVLLEWSQKNKKIIKYQTTQEIQLGGEICFKSCIFIDGEKIACAVDSSKKKAEERVARRAFYNLNKKEKIITTVY